MEGSWKEGFLEEEAPLPFLQVTMGAEHLGFCKIGRALMMPWAHPSRSCSWGGEGHPLTEKKLSSSFPFWTTPPSKLGVGGQEVNPRGGLPRWRK